MIAAYFYTILLPFIIDIGSEKTNTYYTAETDSIQSNFILRVEDLFTKNSLTFISLDRMSAKTGTRRYGLEGPQPEIMLDGIPFKTDFFGTIYTQHIPAALPQINRIDFKDGAGVYNGISHNSASMNFITEPVADGVSVFLSGQTGHNIGEPGPWVFDPESVTPNVERFGPWGDAGLSLKFGSWYAKGLVRSHSYKRMDVSVQNRFKSIRTIPAEEQSLEVDARTTLGLAETGLKNSRVHLQLQAIHTDGKDFFFFQPLGREVPSLLETEQYSAFLKFYLTDQWFIRTLYQYREKRFGHRRNHFDHEFGLTGNENSVRSSTFYGSDSNYIEGGVELEWIEFNGIGMNEDYDFRRDRFFLNTGIRLFHWLHVEAYQKTAIKDEDWSLQTEGRLAIDLTPDWTTTLKGGYSELFSDESNPIDYKVLNGYTIFERLDISSTLPQTLEKSRLTSLSVSNMINLSQHLQLEIDFEFVNHLSFHIPFQPVEYSLTFNTFPGDYKLFEGEKGKRFYTDLTLKHTLSDRFNHQLLFSYNSTLDGGSVYTNYWKTIPEKRMRYTALFKPYHDLELMLKFKFRSETTWEEFDKLDGEINRSFFRQIPFQEFELSKTTPSHLNVDLRVSKWFWNQRIRGVLQFKNILNRDIQYHPIGVVENFGFMSRVEIRF